MRIWLLNVRDLRIPNTFVLRFVHFAQKTHSLICGQVHRYEIRFRLRRAFNFSVGPRVLICDQLCLSTVIYRCFVLFAFSQRRWVVRHDLRTMFTNTFQRLYHRANEPITDGLLQIL